MTPAEKKERRELKKRLQKAVLSNHFSVAYKLRATNAQLKADSKKVADQLLSGHNPLTVIPIGDSQ